VYFLIIYFYQGNIQSYHISSGNHVFAMLVDNSDSNPIRDYVSQEDRLYRVDAEIWPQLVTFVYCRLPNQKQIDQYMHHVKFQNEISRKREELQSRLSEVALDNQKAAEQFAEEYNKIHAMDSESFSQWKNNLEEDLDFYCEDEESFSE